MARILITGSTEGIGRAAAVSLLDDGHDIVVHARNDGRLEVLDELVSRGARPIVGDLADPDQVGDLGDQAAGMGPLDAVIHNAGVIDGAALLPVNVVAPYLLTESVRATRLIYLSSSMHRGGRPDVGDADWSGGSKTVSYSDSKLLVTVLMAAVARRRPDVVSHAVDPGWVPTRMGGPSASDDLALGHVTQAWLATTNDLSALVSGGYWHHQRRQTPHPAVNDEAFQDELLAALAEHTGVTLTP
ncbi:SDR family NAD(P)-dependent oxidoreductase [Microbacterium sp. ISL-103]|uniref:SDR family NAD(P)-dependent oxidoreductase n=1 Tax=Microbacterium sp. ISL-103 TaxID=2819156 RepID=UPI001BEA670E|nr:SDR family NAD(P)-dependent oxidoreductase [Microbacterium sp. ISL-103]MBT2474046.1 SDR family NAD(P)-dependent oxidoreductase [Microbacterium sp. ISL-103]